MAPPRNSVQSWKTFLPSTLSPNHGLSTFLFFIRYSANASRAGNHNPREPQPQGTPPDNPCQSPAHADPSKPILLLALNLMIPLYRIRITWRRRCRPIRTFTARTTIRRYWRSLCLRRRHAVRRAARRHILCSPVVDSMLPLLLRGHI